MASRRRHGRSRGCLDRVETDPGQEQRDPRGREEPEHDEIPDPDPVRRVNVRRVEDAIACDRPCPEEDEWANDYDPQQGNDAQSRSERKAPTVEGAPAAERPRLDLSSVGGP